MPIEVMPPKYVVIVNAIQERIRNGTYAVGQPIPSESQLAAEFDTSRVTVVRSLGILQQAGWIEAQHGKGRFVRSRVPTDRQVPEHAAAMLGRDEVAGVHLLSAGAVLAPNRAAAALGIAPGSAVIARQRLVTLDGIGPIELGTVYIPVDLSVGTEVAEPHPIDGGVLKHLTARRGIAWGYASERMSARAASADEARLLEIGRRECVLTLLLTACDRAGKPRLAVDVVIPASRHELEDQFPLT
jgi:GntR family transcriptional regulator